MRGLSPTNLDYMHAPLRRCVAGHEIPPRVVGRLPLGHVRELLDKLDDQALREWCAGQAVEHGWSWVSMAGAGDDHGS